MLDFRRDNDGKRFINDRRKLSYSIHIPERRSGNDRRSDKNQKQIWEQKDNKNN